ncbi:type II toxin-antitoxin system HicB family antitoxin [Methylobacterium sp. Leaf108]|uniref:type II toxin-antitoxin system HicB family antitoxin n=1 Tax=Methylobacterium sp. Leaf108 TaxID=1736256 RepID=UPI0006F1F798|nr:type II toxin-antitoxin system HicB family antitoxin [Methylobacterium sp. Leaf108]KQP61058.1 hypothetical protein ASF39_15390 [Methylobacterium sp. Leaf108]
MAQVVMLIHEDAGTFGASFPDFPGATTAAGDLDVLYRKATNMLVFHLGGMAEDGDAIPTVRTLTELRTDPSFQEDAKDAVVGVVSVDLPGAMA